MRCGIRAQGFDPNVGLFRATSDNQLYPSPAAAATVPQVCLPSRFSPGYSLLTSAVSFHIRDHSSILARPQLPVVPALRPVSQCHPGASKRPLYSIMRHHRTGGGATGVPGAHAGQGAVRGHPAGPAVGGVLPQEVPHPALRREQQPSWDRHAHRLNPSPTLWPSLPASHHTVKLRRRLKYQLHDSDCLST